MVIKSRRMGWAGMKHAQKRCETHKKKFQSENLKGRDHLEDLDLREIRRKGVDWIHLTQDRDQWRAVVNTVMNLQVP
jgi:hypothetical protein